MKNFRLLLSSLFMVLLIPAVSFALSFSFNVNGTGAGSASTISKNYFNITGSALVVNDFTSPPGGDLGTFTETGTFFSSGTGGGPATWGNGQLTAVFTASGVINSANQFSFSSGSLDMYVDTALVTNYGEINTGDSAYYGANDTIKIASWNLLSGGGKLGDNFTPDLNGTITANFVADSILSGYLFYGNTDLNAYTVANASPILTVAISTTNASTVTPMDVGFLSETNTFLGTSYTDQNNSIVAGQQVLEVDNGGQFRMAVVPEPTTIALFGIGLFGLGVIYRKKRNI